MNVRAEDVDGIRSHSSNYYNVVACNCNPSVGYAANGIVFMTTALVISGNLVAVLICFVAFAITWHRRMNAEEAMMLSHHLKSHYADYCMRVPYRLIPGVY